MQLPIASGSYSDLGLEINNQRCVNWFPAASGPGGRGSSDDKETYKVLKPTAGLRALITDIPGNRMRNIIAVRDKVYITIDNTIYKTTVNNLSKTATWEILGTLGTSTGIVTSAYNPKQIIWVDGSETARIYMKDTTGIVTTGPIGGSISDAFVAGNQTTIGSQQLNLSPNAANIHPNGAQLIITTTSNVSTVPYTIFGLNSAGNAIQESGNLPNNSTKLSVLKYASVYAIAIFGVVSANMRVGAVDMYTLKINGTTIEDNINVSTALPINTLINDINLVKDTTKVTATSDGSGGLILTTEDSVPITISESGFGFLPGVDGITVAGGVFESGTLTAFNIIDKDNGYAPSNQVVFIGGLFIIAEIDTATLWFSNINDGMVWDGLARADAEYAPDNIVALGVSKGELWVIGETSTEIWYNAGNPEGAPFSPRRGLELSIGCAAPESVASLNDLLVWIDNRGYIVQSDVSPYLRNQSSGYDLKIISNDAITDDILKYTVRSDAIAIIYNDRGHLMYQVSFITDKKTWVFDYLTKNWHERLYYSTYDGELQHHMAQFSCEYNNLTLIGGVRNSNLYIMDEEYVTDDGVNIRRIRTTPVQYDRENLKFITIKQLALVISTIRPIPLIGDSNNPQIRIRFSGDSGRTWSSYLSRDVGRTGEYGKTITWNNLATKRSWIIEFSMSDAVSVALTDAWIKL